VTDSGTGPADEPAFGPGPVIPPVPVVAPAPAPESAEAAPPARSSAMPGALSVVGRGLDLNLAASGILRRASLYVGVLTLLAAGPIAAIVWAISARQGGFEWLRDLLLFGRPVVVLAGAGFELLAFVAFGLGVACLAAISIDAQLLALTLVGGQATGRRFDLRDALAVARLDYWRLVRSSLLVGLILLVPRFFLNLAIMNGRPVGTETEVLLVTAAGVVLAVPFAYVGTGVVLGGVGAAEAVRRSWRLAQARWRLAFLLAIVNAAVSYLASFAIGAGADILVRLGTALGLGGSSGSLQVVALGLIVVLAIVSIGSLIMTIAALSVAPQVVAFVGLTGYSSGLDAGTVAFDTLGPPRTERLITRPMKIALVIEGIAAVLAIFNGL
jgi:hypothetical protein